MDWNIVKLWYPVNMIFVAMLLTSFWALKELGVATSTILKSTSNIFVIAAEYFLYGRVYNIYIWGTMGLMILSAFCGGLTDLNFSASGYTWQLINGLLTASYTIYLK
jgi:GDP-mannose transporter